MSGVGGVRPILENSTACQFIDAMYFVWPSRSCPPVGRGGLFVRKLDSLVRVLVFIGEFDPGSGRTLAACLTHASRTMKPSLLGGLVANG